MHCSLIVKVAQLNGMSYLSQNDQYHSNVKALQEKVKMYGIVQNYIKEHDFNECIHLPFTKRLFSWAILFKLFG